MPPTPDLCPSEARLETQIALLRLLEDHGVNRLYGRQLYGALRAHGLVNVDSEGRVLMLRKRHCRRVHAASGNFLEMYDFQIFGYYAAAIARTFFPPGTNSHH